MSFCTKRGMRLRAARIAEGLSQPEACALLKIRRTRLYWLEYGGTPTHKELGRMARAYAVSAAWFVHGDQAPIWNQLNRQWRREEDPSLRG